MQNNASILEPAERSLQHCAIHPTAIKKFPHTTSATEKRSLRHPLRVANANCVSQCLVELVDVKLTRIYLEVYQQTAYVWAAATPVLKVSSAQDLKVLSEDLTGLLSNWLSRACYYFCRKVVREEYPACEGRMLPSDAEYNLGGREDLYREDLYGGAFTYWRICRGRICTECNLVTQKTNQKQTIAANSLVLFFHSNSSFLTSSLCLRERRYKKRDS
jgi:hypothetical protein